MRVLLCGYYGFGNVGDEAILEVIVQRMRARFPDAGLDVLSATPQATATRYGVGATQRWELRAVRRAIARADAVVCGGGGLLQSATSLRSLFYYAGIVREAIRLRRKTMIFAQSIGPLDRLGAMLVRRFCRGVDRATVRDERSRALLSSLLPGTRVERTADPVFLYDAAPSVDLTREGLGAGSEPYAIVCVREAPGFAAGVALLARAADRLAQAHGIRVAFLPLGGAADAAASTTVIRACSAPAVLLPEPALATAAAAIAGARLVVGMRLHALVLAARYAVPFVAVPYDPKVSALLDDLEYPLEPLLLPQRGARAQDVEALVDAAVARHDELRAHLAARIERVRALAERNFDVLGELMAE
ncbi:MAG TPA: polysaccharide pyruvyl transferase CsaB [Candidatus Dormibacteraeota bacterium]|nr:polysaccharide pyruvyl transferase CsaB [Candidatus Dormibacteraeota bacterium]